MKQIPIILAISILFMIGFAGYKVGADNKPIVIERYIPIDTTENVISKVNNTKYIIDSLQQANDSLTGKLQVTNYKLERIRYYNDVAKRGNNIKFLRGWINRVLDGTD